MTASAASGALGSVERIPNSGRSPLELLDPGIYYEFIAIPCNSRYTMPLGIYRAPKPMFKAYKEAGLYNLLKGGVRKLFLLAPRDPLAFYESVFHVLESRLEWGGDGCPGISEDLGLWLQCTPTIISETQEGDVYECSDLSYIAGSPPPYTRVTGCLVELLVIYTKTRAGVIESGYLEYAMWLKWCVERASRGELRYVSAVDTILQELRRALGES